MRLLFTVWGGMHGERSPYEDLFVAGAELACRQHAESLAAFGHEVVFACFGPRERDEQVRGVRLLQRRHPLAGQAVGGEAFWRRHFEAIFDASVAWTAKVVRREGIDAIYTRVLWPTGVIGYRVQELTGVPCAATVDDRVFVEQLLDGPGRLPEAVRARWADAMTAACEGTGRLILLARHLEREVRRFTASPAPWEVIPSGVEPGRFANVEPVDWRARFGLPRSRLLLMCAARLDWPKRQDLLIEAVSNLVAEGEDVGLILLGAGSRQDSLRRLAMSRGVGERVHFLGYQPNDVVPAALLGADVICAPTEWEAFPIQMLEALATGKPMVASAAPPYDEVLAGQDCIPLCPNEAGAWTAALRWAIGEGRRAEVNARRRAFVRERLQDYTQEATSRAIEAALAEMAAVAARTGS